MRLPEPPASLLDDAGLLRFGAWRAPVPDVDLDRAVLRYGSLTTPRAWARFRLKEWQHFVVIHPQVALTFAVVDTRFLQTTWVHVVDREAGTHFEHARQGPALGARVARSLWDGRTSVSRPSYRVDVHSHLDASEHRIELDVAATGPRPAVRGHLRCLHDPDELDALVVLLPVGRDRGMYSHKVPLPVEGDLTVGGRTYTLDADTCTAILDEHKAHYPHHTWWNWATGAGRDSAGRRVAFNLTHNVNTREDEVNENAVWIDGVVHGLGPARMEHADDVLRPWHVRTTDGAVDLRFTPDGERAQRIALGIVKSAFHQPFGTFTGTIRVDDEVVEVTEAWGVCEDHDARW